MINLQANSTNMTSVSISWDPPAIPNWHILNYSISITDIKNGNTLREAHIVNTNIHQTKLGMCMRGWLCIETFSHNYCIIESGVPYNVSVAAVNGSGEGEPSVLIHFTQELGMWT